MFAAPDRPRSEQVNTSERQINFHIDDKLFATVTRIGRRVGRAIPVAGMRGLILMLAGSLAFQTIGSCASATALDGRLESSDPINAAMQACRSNAFDRFLRLFAQSKAVRERFTADQVNVAAAGDAASHFMTKADYLGRLPIATHGWNYVAPDSLTPGKAAKYLLIRTSRVAKTVWRVDWANARFDNEPANGKWIGVPVEIRGPSGKLTFVTADDGCWRLSDDVEAPKDTPFKQGVPRLHCTVRGDDYRRELARVERGITDHPEDMGVGRDLTVCAKLTDTIERTIRSTPKLNELRHAIDRKLASLARRQTPGARAALAQDEGRARRSIMLAQYVLADGTTEDWDLPGTLEQRLRDRLAELTLIAPSRQDYVGEWINASGTLDISRDGAIYNIDANPVDIDFLAWTCEFEGRMHRTKDGLELDDVEGETVHARLRGGVLIVEHRPTSGGFIRTCGANGSISGTYFPTRPEPKPPAGLDNGPPLEFTNP
jgi:hypothetical protein